MRLYGAKYLVSQLLLRYGLLFNTRLFLGGGRGRGRVLTCAVFLWFLTAYPQLFHKKSTVCGIRSPMDTPTAILVLVGGVCALLAVVDIALSVCLIWAYRRLQPQEVLESEVVRLANEFETLKGKYLRLRGQKARAAAQGTTAPTVRRPGLEGLSEEDAALFNFQPVTEEMEE